MTDLPGNDRAQIEAAARRLGMHEPEVEELTGGTRNRCYRIADGSRAAVVRIGGAHDAEYAVVRAAEARAQRVAAAHGLAPRLLHEDLSAAVMVMDYVAGPVWDAPFAASPAGAARAGEWLGRLHAIPVPADMHDVDFLASLEGYCRRLGPGAGGGQLLAEAHRRLGPRRAQRSVCHNDLHHLNLVESPRGLLALDWEYAGAGDPLLDLAGFAAYHDLQGAALEALLEGYGGVAQAPPGDGEFQAARWVFEAVWWAWLELKRRLDGTEPASLAAARTRLERRLGLPPR